MAAEAGTAVRTMDPGGWVASDLAHVGTKATIRSADFGAWMAMEQRRIYLLCLHLLRNSEDAGSATQDTFLKAYQAIQRRDAGEIESPEKWITRIAVNTCLDLLRSRRWLFWKRRVPAKEEQAILSLVPCPGPGPERTLHSNDIGRRISAALDRLSLRQRTVFILRHDEDRSLEEIGELLGLDVGTVKAHMSRALRNLREELRDLYGKPALE